MTTLTGPQAAEDFEQTSGGPQETYLEQRNKEHDEAHPHRLLEE